jgi:hypothetical protein
MYRMEAMELLVGPCAEMMERLLETRWVVCAPVRSPVCPANQYCPGLLIPAPGDDRHGAPLAVGEQYGRLWPAGLEAVGVHEVTARDACKDRVGRHGSTITRSTDRAAALYGTFLRSSPICRRALAIRYGAEPASRDRRRSSDCRSRG